MAFPINEFPFSDFHSMDVRYWLAQFEQIKNEWRDLYNELANWKTETDTSLETWKANETSRLNAWQTQVEQGLTAFETELTSEQQEYFTNTNASLNAWKTDFETLFNTTFSNLTQIKTDAEAARDDAETAARSVERSAAQIEINETDITDLKNKLNYNKNVTPGYILRATNNGTGQEWAPVGTPTDEQTAAAISNWLDAHPEATTTVDFRIINKVFSTVASMKADWNISTDMTCITRGYYSEGDGGGALYRFANLRPAEFYEELANGLYAIPILGDTCNVKQYGAKGDGITDDTTALNNAVLYGAETVYFPEGIYSTEGINCAFKNKTLIGYGATLKSNVINKRVSRYALLSNYPQGRTWSSIVYDDYVNIFGLTLDGNKEIYNTDDPNNEPHYQTGGGITLALFKNVNIKDCIVKNTVMSGIWTSACNNVYIDNCNLIDISLDVDKTGSLDYIWDAIALSSSITIDNAETKVICNSAMIQNCKVIRSLGGAISSTALNTTIKNNYIEDNGGYCTEDGFIASSETPVITGYTFVRNIINNVYNRVNLQVYHNNDRFKGNNLIVNFIGNQIIDLGGAPNRPVGASPSAKKNGLFGCVVTPAQTEAYITIKDNIVMSADESPYSTGNWFDIVGVILLDIFNNKMTLNAAFYNTNNRINAKNLNFCNNEIELSGNNQNLTSLFIYASNDYDIIMDSLKIKNNKIISSYTGSGTGSSVFMCSPSSIKDKIKDCEVSENVFRGAADRFFGLIGGTIEKLFIKNNIVDANYLIANRTAAEAAKGLIKDNISSTRTLLTPGYPLTMTVGEIANNYPDESK